MRSLIATLVLAAACLSQAASAQQTIVSRRDFGSAPWSELVGLTVDGIRTRLGLGSSGDLYATQGYSLRNGVEVAEVYVTDLVPGGLCVDPQKGYAHGPSVYVSHFLHLTFHNGRLASLRMPSMDPMPPPQKQVLLVSCVIEAGTMCDRREPQCDRLLTAAASSTPAQDAAFEKSQEVTSNLIDAFAELRLGAPPPGGVAAWAAKWGDLVRLELGANGVTTIGFTRGGNSFPNATSATLRNGVVEAVDPGGGLHGCRVRPDRSLRCRKYREIDPETNMRIDISGHVLDGNSDPYN